MAKPIETLRDGSLSATIWKNESEKGAFFSVQLTRVYEDQHGNLHDSNSFTGAELLRIANLATKAYELTSSLRREEKAKATVDEVIE